MTLSMYWLQCGCCSGDSWSLLNAEAPDLAEGLRLLDVDLLWHPSLSTLSPTEHRRLRKELVSGDRPLDILCIEGAIIRGPGGTGMFDTLEQAPKKDLAYELAQRAQWVVAMGTCASYGGMLTGSDVEATGLQYHRETRGGFLGADFESGSGFPVVNVPGCPAHTDAVLGLLAMLATGGRPRLDEHQRPLQWYGMLVHQGCTRNEYHEYRVEEKDFGEKGCMFFHLGCQGPLTYGPCNRTLWNRRSSKTRVGVPCHGCTSPDFPRPFPFFRTRNIEGIPLDLPAGVKRAHYMVYKGMAAVATPQRLKDRRTEV